MDKKKFTKLKLKFNLKRIKFSEPGHKNYLLLLLL